MKRLVLASASPRRKDLLEKTGLPFHIVPSDYEEDMTLDLPPRELVAHLAEGKAQAVASKEKNAVVIGADTFITFDEKVLGKPHTPEKARETLHTFRGNTHSILTGFAVIDSESGKTVTDVAETLVRFRDLSDEEVEEYIATGEPLDKAGAYAIQGQGAALVESIEGSYDNVVGLPVELVLEALKEFEFDRGAG